MQPTIPTLMSKVQKFCELSEKKSWHNFIVIFNLNITKRRKKKKEIT